MEWPEPTDPGPSGPPATEGLDVAILDVIPDPFYALGPDLRVVYVNQPALRFWGLTSDQVIGRPWDVFSFGERLFQAIASRRFSEFEMLAPRDGAWLTMQVSPLPNGGTAVFWRDITDRRRAEEALHANEERLRALNAILEMEADDRGRQLSASRARMQAFFDNSTDWLSLFRRDAEGGFRYVDLNPACAAAYGLSREQVQGLRLEEVLGAEQAVLPTHYLREAIRTGRPQRYHVHRTLAGRTSVIDVVFVLATGDAEPEPLIISTARDLTERTELEDRLRQALKMEALSHLTGGIAHDFNNLLTAVIPSLEMIQRRSSEEGVQMLAARALRAATRGAELTAQLLAFSRKEVLSSAPVDVGALLAETGLLLRGGVGETVELILENAPGLWMTKVDAAQFQAAVMNLAVNARDAMERGGRVVIGAENVRLAPAEATADLPAADYVVVRVSDSGHGMSPLVLARVFEPFFTTKPVGKGSGLGLSMVHGFVKRSGGAIRIATAPDAGTTVSLFLPREAAPRP